MFELKFALQQGVEAKDNENEQQASKTTKDDLKPIESSLQRALDLTKDIDKNMNDLRMSDQEQELLTESTTTTVIILGCTSIGVVLISVAVQMFYLKSFFKQRKIL